MVALLQSELSSKPAATDPRGLWRRWGASLLLSVSLVVGFSALPAQAASSVASGGINPDGTVDPSFALSLNQDMQERLKNITLDSFNALPKCGQRH